jgi:hypothetical protein
MFPSGPGTPPAPGIPPAAVPADLQDVLAYSKARGLVEVWACGRLVLSAEGKAVRAAFRVAALAREPEGRRGRKRLTPAEIAERRGIQGRWLRAKECGVSKAQFCEDERIDRSDLDTILRRFRAQ